MVHSNLHVNEFIFKSPEFLFQSNKFFTLNASIEDVFLECKLGKNNGVACLFNYAGDGAWISPSKGTFSGPFIQGKVGHSDYSYSLSLFEDFLLSKGAQAIEYVLPPMYLNSAHSSLTYYVLNRLGYENTRTDLNYHLVVSNLPFDQSISSSKRKLLKKLTKKGMYVKNLGLTELERVYALLQRNRAALGVQLSMEQERLRSLLNHFPTDHLIIGSLFGHKMVSAAICIKIRSDTLYVFYWGHDTNEESSGTTLLLAEFLYKLCQANNIKFLDLGTSTIGNQQNQGLIFFKKSIGGMESIKCRFRKTCKT